MIVTQARLRELFEYDPATGLFTRKSSRGGYIAGSVAGCTDKDGYVMVMVDRRSYKAHRLAWLYVHGEWPEGDIDHRNEQKFDNRIANLRPATRAQNMQNRSRANRNSTSGVLGVMRVGKRWLAQIHAGGKRQHLGRFDTAEQARAAYLSAKQRVHEGAT